MNDCDEWLKDVERIARDLVTRYGDGAIQVSDARRIFATEVSSRVDQLLNEQFRKEVHDKATELVSLHGASALTIAEQNIEEQISQGRGTSFWINVKKELEER